MDNCDYDLYNYSKNKVMSEKEALEIILQAAKGLKYLHDKGYVHRDIKGENIMYCDDKWKIIDFGMLEKERKFRGLMGTLDFLSPEMIQSISTKHHRYKGKPADIWALGMTLYEMMYRKLPFVRKTINKTYDAIVNDDIDYSERILSTKMQKLLEGMLEKDPNKRLNIEEVIKEIQSII